MARAFLVVGPEGSGTRWVTSLFIAAGCYGDAGHEQRLDIQIPNEPLMVWRRSQPHNKIWVDLQTCVHDLVNAGVMTVNPVVCIRDWSSIAKSQIKEGYAENELEAYRKITKVYNMIFYDLSAKMFVYEAAMLYKQEYVSRFMRELNLTVDFSQVEFKNGDDKYYL